MNSIYGEVEIGPHKIAKRNAPYCEGGGGGGKSMSVRTRTVSWYEKKTQSRCCRECRWQLRERNHLSQFSGRCDIGPPIKR